MARRLWRVSKFFKLPLNDSRMMELNQFDLAFYEFSMLADNPEALESYKNRFYDDEFDEWLEDFDKEQKEKALSEKINKPQENLEYEEKEGIKEFIDDWEEVE